MFPYDDPASVGNPKFINQRWNRAQHLGRSRSQALQYERRYRILSSPLVSRLPSDGKSDTRAFPSRLSTLLGAQHRYIRYARDLGRVVRETGSRLPGAVDRNH
jgi:hypothetical protein